MTYALSHFEFPPSRLYGEDEHSYCCNKGYHHKHSDAGNIAGWEQDLKEEGCREKGAQALHMWWYRMHGLTTHLCNVR